MEIDNISANCNNIEFYPIQTNINLFKLVNVEQITTSEIVLSELIGYNIYYRCINNKSIYLFAKYNSHCQKCEQLKYIIYNMLDKITEQYCKKAYAKKINNVKKATSLF